MSIALTAKTEDLERRVAELEKRLGGMSRIEFLSHLAQLELRIEKLEARKPGPKPKDGAHG